MSSIAATTFIRIASPAIQRAGSMIFQKLSRLHKIDSAIKGISSKSLQDSALADYITIKGTWNGEYNDKLDRFLQQFEKTGLATALITQALSGIESQSVHDAFVSLYSSEMSTTDGAESLYSEINRSFSVTVTELSKDPVLLAVFRAANESFAEYLSHIETSIEGIKSGISRKPDEEAFSLVISRLIRSLQNRYKSIRVETSQGPKDVDITRYIYHPDSICDLNLHLALISMRHWTI